VILACPTNCHVPPCDGRVRKNPIEQVEKKPFEFYTNSFPKVCALIAAWDRFARWRNPITALRKKCSDSNNRAFAEVLLLITSRNPFGRRKNPSNTGHAWFLQKRRNRRENGCTVTTSHVFWPNERRKRAFSLPISRPIFNALGGKCKRESQRGAGGVRHGRPGKSARSITSHGNFHANGSPTLSDPRKKTLCKGSDAQWIPCSKQPPKVPMPDGRCDSA
jgi:hypothetical protein